MKQNIFWLWAVTLVFGIIHAVHIAGFHSADDRRKEYEAYQKTVNNRLELLERNAHGLQEKRFDTLREQIRDLNIAAAKAKGYNVDTVLIVDDFGNYQKAKGFVNKAEK